MCGIASIVGNKPNKGIILTEILERISHRGEKKYFGELENLEFCSLGMNRLAIVDRENAKQPICDISKRYWIVLNGEIYNYKELQEELKGKGYIFKTDSDTEVLLYGFIEWQEKVVEKINGMYAFFVFDNQTKEFFVARDPIGVKPLYYTQDKENNRYFASEIKSLCFLDEIEKIENFPSGSYMKNEKITKFFTFPEVDNYIIENDAIIEIRKLLDESVKMRVQTDLPVAVYLSGGIDSTAVLATASKYHNDVMAIIVGNEQSTDRKFAERYCKENNIKYIIKQPPTEEEIVKKIAEIVEITESFEPNMIRQSAISYFIAEAGKDFKIILCGEGADEIFAGYPEFTKIDQNEIDGKIRQFLCDLHRTQLQRVDRTSMHWTTEVREPLLDKNLIQYVLKIPANLKIKKIGNETITKYIFRKAMEDRLPEYIFNRPKVVLSEGAGYKGNQKIGGLFYDIVSKNISDEELENFQRDFKDWNLQTKEEIYYFKFFLKFKYDKADFNKIRTTTNKADSYNKDNMFVQSVFDSFNTWKFKREQPFNENQFFEIIRKSVKNNEPIKFVMYWGKGERDFIGKNELQALDFLKTMFESISRIYKEKTRLTIVYTDTHAKLNGFEDEEIQSYKNSLEEILKKYNFSLVCMSKIANLEKYDEIKVEESFLNLLVNSARKHYKGNENIQKIAKWYYQQNQIEKQKITEYFENHIFLTYNGSEINPLFPEKMPIFYMYSTKKGDSEKPWFKE
jgi:asparagine synthase (glutamine-hydrolysing)